LPVNICSDSDFAKENNVFTVTLAIVENLVGTAILKTRLTVLAHAVDLSERNLNFVTHAD